MDTAHSAAAAPTPSQPGDDDRSLRDKLDDASLQTRVKQALIRTSALRVFPFQLTVVDGQLTLRGDVNTRKQYRRAERVASQVSGITSVTNQLTIGGSPVTEAHLTNSDTDDAETSEDTAVYHTVRPGDSLWEIARKYGASVQRIRSLNDLRSTNLRPGQRIRVR